MVNPTIKPSVVLLKEITLFGAFTEKQLQTLLEKGKGIQYEAHTNIVIEGELTWGLYIIMDGLLGVFKNNKLTGQSYDVGQLRSGSFFGEMSLIDQNPRSATVKTLTETQLFHISKDVFMDYLNLTPDLKLKFYLNCVSTLVNRLRELDDNYVISQYQLWQSALKKGGGES